ncbi:MAG: SRPBCC family protein [Candidatus Korobacteraceae bacterium]
MTESATNTATQDIVVEQILAHAPETIWKTLTDGQHIGRWLMESKGFEPVVGTRFTLHTTPAGAWDGVIQCEVLEVVPNHRLSYSWRGGHDDNTHYGSRLDTRVTFTLIKVDGGTRVRVVHSGFVLPKNATALRNMSEGWKKVVGQVGTVSGEGAH